MKIRNEFIAILLTVAMVFTSTPAMVWAETVQGNAAVKVEQNDQSESKNQSSNQEQAEAPTQENQNANDARGETPEQDEQGNKPEQTGQGADKNQSAAVNDESKAGASEVAKTSDVKLQEEKATLKDTNPTPKTGLVYNGAAQQLLSAKGDYSYFSLLETKSAYKDNISSIKGTDAGTYTIYCRKNKPTYTSYKGDISIKVTIDKATITSVTLSGTTEFNWDGNKHSVTIDKVYAQSGSATIEVPKTVKIAVKSYDVYNISDNEKTDPGEYKVKVEAKPFLDEKTQLLSNNYTGSATASWKINPPPLHIVDEQGEYPTSGREYTYNGSVQKPILKLKNGSSELNLGTDYTITYNGSSENSKNASDSKYSATIKGVAGTTYQSFNQTVYWTINKAALPANTVSENSNLTYNGKAQALVSVSSDLQKLINAGEVTVYYKRSSSGSETTSVPKETEVAYEETIAGKILANYHVYYRIDGGTNYEGKEYIKVPVIGTLVQDFNVKIQKGTPTVAVVENSNLVYNSSEQKLLASATAHFGDPELSADKRPSVLLNYKKEGETNWALSQWTTDIDKIVAKDAGNYVVGYQVSESDNWNAVSVASKTVTISPKNIGTAADITASALNMAYTGEEVTTTVTVKDGTTKLEQGELGEGKDPKDYTITGDTATDIGLHTVTITGHGNYTGTKEVNWSILDIKITLSETEFTYDTTEHSVTEKVEQKDGTPITDYEIVAGSVKSATNAGSYTVQVKCTGTYADIGTVSLTWEINPAELADGDVKLDRDWFLWKEDTEYTVNATYTHAFENGNTETLVLYDETKEGYKGDYKLDPESSFTNKEDGSCNAGEYFVKIEGTGNYTGTVEAKWMVQGVPLDLVAVALQQRTFTYDKTEKTPQVNVGVLGLLNEGEDYVISGDLSATEVGEYTITVSGKGKYYGTKDLTWTIEGKQLSECLILVKYPSYDIEKNPITGDLIEYEPEISVYDINDMSRLSEAQKELLKKMADGSTILDSASVLLAESALKWLVEINPTDNKKLEYGTEYTISGDTKKSGKGAYTVAVTGGGNYAGTVEKEWVIGDSIKNDLLHITSTHVYDGTVQTPTINTKYPDIVSYDPENYTVQIKNEDGTLSDPGDIGRSDAGTYTLVIKGVKEKKKYGTVELKWTIKPREVKLGWDRTETVYDGTVQRPKLVCVDGTSFVQSDIDSGNVRITEAKAVSLLPPRNADKYAMYARVEFKNGFKETNYSIAQSSFEKEATYVGQKIYDWFTKSIERLDSFTDGQIKKSFDELLGKTKYNRYFTVEFVIKKRPVDIKWSNTEFTYDGLKHIPTAKPKKDEESAAGRGLIENDYCKLELTGEQINAGTYTAEVTGLSWLTGLVGNYELDETDKTCEFTIKGKPINDITVVARQKHTEKLIFNNKNQSPTINAMDHSLAAFGALEEGVDFEVNTTDAGSEFEAKNAGGHKVIINGIGNYSGSTEVMWEILPLNLRWVDPVVTFKEKTFNGKEQMPELESVVIDGNEMPIDELAMTEDSAATNAGEHPGTLIGIAKAKPAESQPSHIETRNIVGRHDVTWVIQPKQAVKEDFQIDMGEYIFNGEKQKVNPVLVDTEYDGTLVEGRDYELVNATQRNAGNHVVTINFMGNYSGSFDMEWTIQKKPIVIMPNDASKYVGEKDPKFTFTAVGAVDSEVVKSKDVTITRKAGEKVGKYKLTASMTEEQMAKYTNYEISFDSDAYLTIKPAVNTGDSKHLVMWAFLLALGVLALGGLSIKLKEVED